jgi:hypothetical protein
LNFPLVFFLLDRGVLRIDLTLHLLFVCLNFRYFLGVGNDVGPELFNRFFNRAYVALDYFLEVAKFTGELIKCAIHFFALTSHIWNSLILILIPAHFLSNSFLIWLRLLIYSLQTWVDCLLPPRDNSQVIPGRLSIIINLIINLLIVGLHLVLYVRDRRWDPCLLRWTFLVLIDLVNWILKCLISIFSLLLLLSNRASDTLYILVVFAYLLMYVTRELFETPLLVDLSVVKGVDLSLVH